jgi:hypothetical protein
LAKSKFFYESCKNVEDKSFQHLWWLLTMFFGLLSWSFIVFHCFICFAPYYKFCSKVHLWSNKGGGLRHDGIFSNSPLLWAICTLSILLLSYLVEVGSTSLIKVISRTLIGYWCYKAWWCIHHWNVFGKNCKNKYFFGSHTIRFYSFGHFKR